MISVARNPRLPLYGASLIALIASALPLPHWLDLLRPDFLLLVVIWFAILVPRAGGLAYAWAAGLALDAFRGEILGQNALAFVAVAYLAHRFHLRVRMFPITHQSLVVFMLLFVYQLLLFSIDGFSGHPLTDWARWLPVITGALIWPVLDGMLGRFATPG